MSVPEPTPLEVPAGIAHVAFFGGTFDPPHVAHVCLADRARVVLETRLGSPVWLVFVPAARSPHKPHAPTATDGQRVEMLRLAVAGLPRCTIWTDELDRAVSGEPSYWARTLERAWGRLGDRSIHFIIGADQALNFHRWQGPREMLARAGPLVLPREPITTAERLREGLAATGAWSPAELDAWAAAFVPVGPLPAASTEVRDAQGEAFQTPLHPDVLRYVRAHRLYGF